MVLSGGGAANAEGEDEEDEEDEDKTPGGFSRSNPSPSASFAVGPDVGTASVDAEQAGIPHFVRRALLIGKAS